MMFASVIFSFVLLRRGELEDIKYKHTKYAKAPKYPYKFFGALVLSITTTTSAYLGSYSIISSLMLGLSVFGGWYLYYGFDERDDKIDGFENDKSAQRIMKLLIEANKDISKIKTDANKINSASISQLMIDMANEFKKIVQHIENEPQDYDQTRKYLVSYLKELKSMSEIFVKLDDKQRTKEIENNFQETLQDTIKKLQKQYKKLLDDDLLELDIKLSVMKQRLKNEE